MDISPARFHKSCLAGLFHTYTHARVEKVLPKNPSHPSHFSSISDVSVYYSIDYHIFKL